MRILAIEFSSEQRSAALVECQEGRSPQCLGETIETGERSTQAVSLVESALREAQVEREQVDRIAVGLGPGSYTGIRLAIAFIQGWQLASGVQTLGLGSAECLVAEAHLSGVRGPVAVVIDAQRNEFYLAGYGLGEQGWKETEPLHLATEQNVRDAEQQGKLVIGPEVTRWFAHGRRFFPRAATLGAWACGRNDFVAGEDLRPIYLRATSFVKAPPSRPLPG